MRRRADPPEASERPEERPVEPPEPVASSESPEPPEPPEPPVAPEEIRRRRRRRRKIEAPKVDPKAIRAFLERGAGVITERVVATAKALGFDEATQQRVREAVHPSPFELQCVCEGGARVIEKYQGVDWLVRLLGYVPEGMLALGLLLYVMRVRRVQAELWRAAAARTPPAHA